MSDKDPIVDLFERKLKNAEFKVDPSAWTNIASQLPSVSAPVAKGGMTLASKVIIAAGTTIAITLITASVYIYKNKEEKQSDSIPAVVQQTDENNIIEVEPETPLKGTEIKETPKRIEVITSQDEGVKNEFSIPANETLTIQSIDEIIEQERLVQEDILIEEFIETENKELVAIEESESVEKEEGVVLDELNQQIEIKVPNVFTPNNDGQNDTYHLTYEGNIENVSVVIFNSKGEIVFRSSEPNFNWDGTNLFGDQCPTGKYIFMMTGEDENGNEVLENRDFQLLR